MQALCLRLGVRRSHHLRLRLPVVQSLLHVALLLRLQLLVVKHLLRVGRRRRLLAGRGLGRGAGRLRRQGPVAHGGAARRGAPLRHSHGVPGPQALHVRWGSHVIAAGLHRLVRGAGLVGGAPGGAAGRGGGRVAAAPGGHGEAGGRVDGRDEAGACHQLVLHRGRAGKLEGQGSRWQAAA